MKQLPDNSKKTILFYQPDRYTSRPDSKKADEYITKHANCNFIVTLTWDDFVSKLNINPDLVGFHGDLFNNESLGIQSLIHAIETTLKLKDKKADIFVSINKKTGREVIDILKKTNIIGLQFGRGDFGLEFAAESFRRLIADRTHWPEDKISMLREYQENKKPLHVYFRDDMDSYIQTIPVNEVHRNFNAKFKMCKSWSDLSLILQEQPKNIVFHIDMVRRHGGTIAEFMMMLDTMIKYVNIPIRPNIGVGIEATTHISTIKE